MVHLQTSNTQLLMVIEPTEEVFGNIVTLYTIHKVSGVRPVTEK